MQVCNKGYSLLKLQVKEMAASGVKHWNPFSSEKRERERERERENCVLRDYVGQFFFLTFFTFGVSDFRVSKGEFGGVE